MDLGTSGKDAPLEGDLNNIDVGPRENSENGHFNLKSGLNGFCIGSPNGYFGGFEHTHTAGALINDPLAETMAILFY